jgi:biofilm PGA synthesis N-glycosyltransferase PgaC
MVDSFIEHFLPAICFGYPFVMAWYWMSGGLLYRWIRGRHEPLYDAPVALVEYPSVSILVPCHNEEAQAGETFGILAAIDYPDFEIVAINDGSTDLTAEILDSLATRISNLRVVHLEQNQGKSTALNVGALLAKGEILVGTDGDALLDRHALIWFVRRFQGDARIGGVTGNPRIRNRASLLGLRRVFLDHRPDQTCADRLRRAFHGLRRDVRLSQARLAQGRLVVARVGNRRCGR